MSQAALGEVRTASVACGVLGVGGNKGAAAVAFSLFRRQIACVCSHFAAHQVGSCCLVACRCLSDAPKSPTLSWSGGCLGVALQGHCRLGENAGIL